MNAFEAFGEVKTVAPIKSRIKAAETRRINAEARRAEQHLEEQNALSKRYGAWIRERRETLFAGRWGEQAKALDAFLRRMTLTSAPELLTVVGDADWLRQADADTRFEVLAMIGRAISRVRLAAGLTPFDDPMPGEPNNAFLTIREALQ